MIHYERELQINSMESRIIEFSFDFTEKLKIKVERKCRMKKSRFELKLNKIKP